MDNLTHSVVGLAVGELVERSLPRENDPSSQGLRQRLLLVACWAASNFPDLDLLFSGLLPTPLGYLLHHRGHSHTLLYAIPQTLLLVALIWLLWPAARALLARSRPARAGLAASVALGLLLHLAMDYLNSYGIHPFHPFDARWFYGDMVFILEPVFWVAFGVPMAMMVRQGAARAILLCLLLGAPVGFAAAGFLHWGSILALFALALGLGSLQRRAGALGRGALVGALLAALGFIAMQAIATGLGQRTLAAQLAQRDPTSRLVDIAMTGFPANPLCWRFVALQSDEAAGSYRLRRGVLSVAPGLLPVSACPARLAETRSGQALTPGLAWLSDQTVSLALLRDRARDNCYFRAWLRFARTPALAGAKASDLRFGALEADNFTTLDLDAFAGRACPAGVPGWTPPRADLLAAPG